MNAMSAPIPMINESAASGAERLGFGVSDIRVEIATLQDVRQSG